MPEPSVCGQMEHMVDVRSTNDSSGQLESGGSGDVNLQQLAEQKEREWRQVQQLR